MRTIHTQAFVSNDTYRPHAIFWPKLPSASTSVLPACNILATALCKAIQLLQHRMASFSHHPTCPAFAPGWPQAARSVVVELRCQQRRHVAPAFVQRD